METKTTTQITVRLNARTVEHIDEQVRAGLVASRAAYLDEAAERARRREIDLRDAAIYAATADDPDPDDLPGLAAWASVQPTEHLDVPELPDDGARATS